ncbi:MAG: Dyp-type peroxidase [Myxococcales bacterium]|nr:Dyp-type peroxidase [Myxococcales bacterium]
MQSPQVGILEPVPSRGRHLLFHLAAADTSADKVGAALRAVAPLAGHGPVVLGVGAPTAAALGINLEGLRPFPELAGPTGVRVPASQHALWLWIRSVDDAEDPGALFHRGRQLTAALSVGFRLDASLDVFRHGIGRDLSGYEDGTENPEGEKAEASALVQGRGAGLDGSSYAALQRWEHNFTSFDAMAPAAKDAAIGRRVSDNEEIDDAPPSAHVKRTAQESFEPEAFVVRRSMPWLEGERAGLSFLAFGSSFDAFEAQLGRMLGRDDGVVDALFGFTKATSGDYFWCPPRAGVGVDLRGLGL